MERPAERTRNTRPIFIGADPNPRSRAESFFRGALDEVRLSAGVRYTKTCEPARVFLRDETTLLLFHFDRAAGAIHADDSGHDRHGWPVGAPKLAAEDR